MEVLGKSPIPLPVLILGKALMFLCWVFFLVKVFALDDMLYDSEATQVAGMIFIVIGVFIGVVGFESLGSSARVGLPTGQTELKVEGMYQFTRNPLYLSGFLVCLGSCLYCMHVLNFLFFAGTVAIHHVIVTKEEIFLEQTFGQQWLEYKSRAPRYFGRIRRGHGT